MSKIKELITLFKEGDRETRMYILYTIGTVTVNVLVVIGIIVFIYLVYTK
ncbi:MAG: hypothetical protein U9N35_07150 [Euryarchaeota archaeon]|nr:hypothetical protein [Euryarchaeota archaeon]